MARRRYSLRRLLAVARKELIHLRRDKRMLPIVFVIPVVQLFILGVAANFDVEHVGLVVVDQDHSPVSRAIAARLEPGEAFDLVGVTDSPREAELAMDQGRAEIAVIVPRGTDRALHRGEAADIPIWVDGTDTNRALGAQRYAESILRAVAAERLPAVQGQLPIGTPDPVARVLYNPTFQSRWFMVPAVLAMILTVIVTLLSAMAIVKERENGTIEQLSVTPIRPGELMVGKLGPFVIIGIIQGVLVTLATIYGFGVPFRGSPWDLLGMGVLYLAAMLAFGLLASTVSKTQQQALLTSVMVVLPNILLGGLMYPVSNMEPWARHLSDLMPLTYFAIMIRGVFLKGIGLYELPREAVILAVIATVLLTLAVFRFRKRSA
ncbi:MAG: ABC transporter permease [Pseudomonadota bacterium]